MNLTDEDLAAINAAMSTDKRETAVAEVSRLCMDFLTIAKELRDVDVQLLSTIEPDPALLASKQRLTAAAWLASDAVHQAQRKWMLKGIDIYVAHDRNGSPIRVDKTTKAPTIGFDV